MSDRADDAMRVEGSRYSLSAQDQLHAPPSIQLFDRSALCSHCCTKGHRHHDRGPISRYSPTLAIGHRLTYPIEFFTFTLDDVSPILDSSYRKDVVLKATDLIAALNESIAHWGNREVWIGSDSLLRTAGVEVWKEPFFDEPSVVILVADNGEPMHGIDPPDVAADDR